MNQSCICNKEKMQLHLYKITSPFCTKAFGLTNIEN